MNELSWFAAASVAALALSPWSASAQFGDGLTQSAIAIQAYEKSAERCAYEPIVDQALNRLRDHYAQSEPYRWRRALRENKDADDIVGNAVGLALQESPYTADPRVSAGGPKPPSPADRGCVASGLSVGAALPFAGALIGFDPTLFGEANRLMEGGGRAMAVINRSTQAPAEARPLNADDRGAAAGEAESAVREVLARVLSPVLTIREKAGDDQRFLTRELYELFMKNAREFDSDPYTGSQEPGSYRLVSLSSKTEGASKFTVTAHFDILGLPDAHPVIAYELVQNPDRWRIDDISYISDGGASMRKLLRGQSRTSR